ncbi:MAG: hypothetical protein FWE84_06075, partial [Firmicutes bacterium]|nr:hypothetical protein [Bacillota bacterium]
MLKDPIDVYKVWAPDGAAWTEFVKPVLFAFPLYGGTPSDQSSKTAWLASLSRDTAVIIDLPGEYGVHVGMAAARNGFRPIPLYNGTTGQPKWARDIVKVDDIIFELYGSANELENLNLPSDAPPAFLLDSKRLDG